MSTTIAKYEFRKWIESISMKNLTETDKKFINLLDENFDSLAKLGTSGGARGKRIGEIIQLKHSVLSSDISALTSSSRDSSVACERIARLLVGPFRGFTSLETFEFISKYTFLSGPNGSGKSSFCEALEYGLLGTIDEASAKRITVDTYIKNAHQQKPIKIEITGVINGKSDTISASPAIYRFAFIEKNRIDGFARISSTTATVQKDRIATLFGLDEFNNFVSGFSDDFDDRHIPITNQKAIEFKSKTDTLDVSKTRITKIDQDQATFASEGSVLVLEVNQEPITSINELKVFLDGTETIPGKINALQLSRAESIPDDEKPEIIDSYLNKASAVALEIVSLSSNLESIKQQSLDINFQGLYQAITNIAEQSIEEKITCPACKTPLDRVTTNPFDQARVAMLEFQNLSELQERIKTGSSLITRSVKEIQLMQAEIERTAKIVGIPEQTTPKISDIDNAGIITTGSSLSILESEINHIINNRESFDLIRTQISTYNAQLTEKRLAKSAISSELTIYKQYKDRCDAIVTKALLLTEEKRNLEAAIKQFDIDNQKQILDIALEDTRINTHKEFASSYSGLISSLKAYCNKLPAQLASGLSAQICDYYNIVNGHDPEFEKFETIIMPASPDKKILVKFFGDPKLHDALLVLSEGHIKVLGLAILLAKAIDENLGFIIYDDIVNAIDDDHRSGIADLLMKHASLKDKQHIITCHSDVFITKLEHTLGASNVSKHVSRYRFHAADTTTQRGISMSNGNPQHYILKAEASIESNAIKDAAQQCRQAVEAISEQLWVKLGNSQNGNLTVKMRNPSSKPDLSTVVDSLAKALVSIVGADILRDKLMQVKEKYHWLLLNKGTHHDDSMPEFDRTDVVNLCRIIKEMESLVQSFALEIHQKPII